MKLGGWVLGMAAYACLKWLNKPASNALCELASAKSMP